MHQVSTDALFCLVVLGSHYLLMNEFPNFFPKLESGWSDFPVDTGRKLNVQKTFRRRPGRLLNGFCTFNLLPVSTGLVALIWKRLDYEINEMLFLYLNNLKVYLLHNHKRGLCTKKLASFSIKLHNDGTVKKPILLLYNNKWTRRLSMLAAIFCYV